jgi:tetratricopeptide (TPR) repeat protein
MALLFYACLSFGCMSNTPALSPEEELNRIQLQRLHEEIQKQPQNAELYYKAGLVTIGLGRWEEARGYFEKALERNPRYTEAMYQTGVAWERAGEMYVVGKGRTVLPVQRDKAINAYRKTVDLNPDYAEAFYRLTLLALMKGDLKLAHWASQELGRIEENSDRSVALAQQVYSYLQKNRK